LSSIFLVETGDSYIASVGYDIKKHRVNHGLLSNQSSIFCRHWFIGTAMKCVEAKLVLLTLNLSSLWEEPTATEGAKCSPCAATNSI
jgi:hypothetical protein